MIRPVTFGYLQVGSTATGLPRRDQSLRAVIEAFAEREGFVVVQVFIEMPDSARRLALASLLEASTFTEIAAVIVPDWSHLGPDGDAQKSLQQVIADTTGVPVLAARIDLPRAPAGQQPT